MSRNTSVRILCVQDLLNRGYDRQKLIEELVFVNRETWSALVPERYIWTKRMVSAQLDRCPETTYCAFIDGTLVGSASFICINEQAAHSSTTWESISAHGTFATHDPDGDCAFGLDLSIIPTAQGKGISDQLLQTGFFFSIILRNLKGAFLGARVPGFAKRSQYATIEEHVFGKKGRSRDPEVRKYQSEGFRIVKIVPGYMEDPESLDYGVLMFYPNPFYTRFLPHSLFKKPAYLLRKLFL